MLSTLIRRRIINARDPVCATRRWTPVLVFAVFLTLSLVILYKGLSSLRLDLDREHAMVLSALVAALTAVFGWILVGRTRLCAEDRVLMDEVSAGHRNAELVEDLESFLDTLDGAARGPDARVMQDRLEHAKQALEDLAVVVRARAVEPGCCGERSYRFVNRVFSSLQVVTACCVAFAHGANDVGNAIGPLSGVVSLVEAGRIDAEVAVPFWTLVLGGLCIATGVVTWGPRVMETVGKRITCLTPTGGFSAQFSVAATVVLASRLGLPVSTTHAVVGAVTGVGVAQGAASVDWRVLGKMASMWLLQVPAVATISGLLFLLLRVAF